MKIYKLCIALFIILIFLKSEISFFAQALDQEQEDLKNKEKVQVLNFSGKKEIKDLLPAISSYPNLSRLDLSNSFLQNEDLIHINNPRISYLNLNNTIINGNEFSFISKLPQLKHLSMEGTYINNSILPAIAKLEYLEKLEIGKSYVTDNGIKALQKSKLSILDLSALKISNDSIQSICKMPNIQELYLWNTKITSKEFSNITNLKKLKVLMLGGTEIDNEALNYISKLPNLKFLNVSWTKVTDDGLEYLKDNQSIEVFSLNGNKITKTGIKSISKMKKLKILSMEDIQLIGDYSSNFSDLTRLKVLYLNNASTNKNSIDLLVKKLPWVAIYYNGTLMFNED